MIAISVLREMIADSERRRMAPKSAALDWEPDSVFGPGANQVVYSIEAELNRRRHEQGWITSAFGWAPRRLDAGSRR